MKFSETLQSNMELIVNTIHSCKTVDQLENCEKMIAFFCENNQQNDKMGHAKQFLLGGLAMKSKELEL